MTHLHRHIISIKSAAKHAFGFGILAAFSGLFSGSIISLF